MTENKSIDAEIAILGAGGGGLAAALSAAEAGCRSILVLEKAPAPGGTTVMAHDLFAAESPVQIRQGVDASRDFCFNRAMEWAHWDRVNARLLRAIIDKSGDTVRWLEEKGVVFHLAQFYTNQVPLTRHHIEGNAQAMMKIIREDCQKLGVQVLTRARANRILRGDNGEVTGVLATTKDGELTVTAKSVIIATGGYAGNMELLKKYCPPFYHLEHVGIDGFPNNTGDGLLMAIEAGADTAGLGTLLVSGPSRKWSDDLKIRITPGGQEPAEVTIRLLIWDPLTLWVNKKGHRFMNEGYDLNFFATGHMVLEQPEGISYTLFDSDILARMERDGITRTGGAGTALYRGMVHPGTPLTGIGKELPAKEKLGLMKISDSLDGIADYIGVDRAVLKATMDEYNAACDQGYDPIFAKDRRYLIALRTPPYYAIKANAQIGDTLGGVKINERMEVLDTQDDPIPGLYAAGVVAGCYESENYCYPLSGHNVGFALNLGRIAAENVLQYLAAQ